MNRLIVLSIIAAFISGGDYCFTRPQSSSAISRDSLFKDAVAFSVAPSGMMYVLDKGSNELIKITPDGTILGRTGGIGWSETAFDSPADVYSQSDLRVYVSDYGNHRIEYFDGNLNYLSSLKLHDESDPSNQFGYPKSAAVDRNGSLFITDGENVRLVKIGELNTVELTFGGVGSGEGKITNPRRIRISQDDKVYIQDGQRIMVYDIYGNYLYVIPALANNHFRTFTVSENSVFILDTSGVRGISKDMDTTISYPVSSDFVDIGVNNDSMIFLTRHGLTIIPLDPIWIRKRE